MSIILKAENISKQYRLGTVGTGTLSHDLNRWWHRVRGKEDPYLKIGDTNDRSLAQDSSYIWALKDIDFEVRRGEVLGIIGKNGAGKSTLLKILSRVTSPTTGIIKTKGRIASLLEVGTGFHPEMTGRENIFLNGAILGMTKAEIKNKLDEIVDFSGCVRYIDTPVKRYSSGMRVRLGFAVAAFLEPDILVVDEVLAVGDAEFQKKAVGKMQDISQGQGRTVLFVSHNMGSIKKMCHRCILLENGKIRQIGKTEDILNTYQQINLEQLNYYKSHSLKEFYLKKACLTNYSNNLYVKDDITFEFKIETNNNSVKNKYLLIRLLNDQEQVLSSFEVGLKSRDKTYSLTIPKYNLVKGVYALNCIIYHPAVRQYDKVHSICGFKILDNIEEFSHLEKFDIGSVYFPQDWLK